MTALCALISREIKAFWFSPIAYVIGAVFALLQGWSFWFLLLLINDPRMPAHVSVGQFYFGSFFFWFSIVIMVPLLTMRTFSEEKRTGSIELLLSAPVSNTQVVLAKFLGAWINYSLLWLSTAVFFIILSFSAPFDWRPIVAAYAGTLLLGSSLISLGIFTSSLTRNQIIAGFLAFVAVLALFSLGLLELVISDPSSQEFVRQISILDHMHHFSKGLLDTRPLIYHASIIASSLVLTTQVLESPAFRS
jgi:ABC-2 type transport system permease protein